VNGARPNVHAAAIVEEFLSREGSRLRTIGQRRAALERLVLPKLGSRPIGSITRTDIVRLLDGIAEKSGAPITGTRRRPTGVGFSPLSIRTPSTATSAGS